MSPRQKRRLAFVAVLATGAVAATALVLYSLGQNLLYFYTPSQIVHGEAPGQRMVNIGGIVVEGSVVHAEDTPTVSFALTDMHETVALVYTGLLPDLFREGQGVIATGSLGSDGVFVADRVLAKHDENYMPPEVAETLKKSDRPLGITTRDAL